MNSLQIIANELNPTIICLVETHLIEDDVISIEGYNIVRNDRNRQGGGCLIAYKQQVNTLITHLHNITKSYEGLYINIGNNKSKIKVGTVYMPGENATKSVIEKAYAEISEEIDGNVIICGDFNAKIAENTEETISPSGKIMKGFIKNQQLTVINQTEKCKGKWTRQEGSSRSVIDYVLGNRDGIQIKEMQIDEERNFSVYHHMKKDGIAKTIHSDHNAILTTVNFKGLVEEENKERKVQIMTRKGYAQYEIELMREDVSGMIDQNKPIRQVYKEWEEKVTQIYNKQKKTVKKKNIWKINRKLLENLKVVRKELRNWKGDMNAQIYLKSRKKLLEEHCENEAKLRSTIALKEVVKEIRKSGKTNMEPFWKLNKKTQKSDSQSVRTTIQDEQGNRIEDKEEIKKMYTDYYSELLDTKDADTESGKEAEEIVELAIKAIEYQSRKSVTKITKEEEVVKQVKTLKSRKAKDAIGWHNEQVIYGGHEMIKSLARLFTMIDAQREIPESWERVWIKTIFKDGRVRKVDKTRGLFMTSVVGKIKEKVIKSRNEESWEMSSSPFQCGGKKGTSTIDHTLTLLEIVQRNKYLNKNTYVVFIDMEKCFDKLWLQDGIVELWKSGMDVRDANILLKMNKIAQVKIETPVGITKEIQIEDTVKQGTIYGPVICSKEMERINGIGERAVTLYGPSLQIETLAYVDDLSGIGDMNTIKKVIRNVQMMEERKKVTVNINKSKYMVIGKGINDDVKITTTLKNGKLESTDEYKYLGTWLNKEGNCELNIKKRKEKCERAISKIMSITHPTKIGRLATAMKIELHKAVLLPILLYNMEAWGKLRKSDLDELERYQGQILRRILNLPKTTIYTGILQETGIWKVKDTLRYKRLMLLHNIVNSNPNRVVTKMIQEQEQNGFPGCWLNTLKMECDQIGVKINTEEIKKKRKDIYKKEVKSIIVEKMSDEIKSSNKTKLRRASKSEFKLKDYIEEGLLDEEEIREALMIRLNMKRTKTNFKEQHQDIECRLCGSMEETTEHLLNDCVRVEYLREGIKYNKADYNKDNAEAMKQVITLWKRIEMMMI